MIKFSAPIKPMPFERAMQNGKRRFNSQTYTAFKDILGYLAKQAMDGRPPLKGEVKLCAFFFKPKPENAKGVSFVGDVDNYLKAVLDALQGICYKDDRQVVEVFAKKSFGNFHIDIEVEEVSGEIDNTAVPPVFVID